MKKRDFRAVGLVTAFCLALLGVSITPSISQAADPVIRGTACQPGQGVTVVVDYAPYGLVVDTPDGVSVDVRCVPGASGSMIDLLTAAGFAVTTSSGGSALYGINGIDPTSLYGSWDGYWEIYTSTSNGYVVGSPGTEWKFSQDAVSARPVSTDQAYLFRAVDSWDCMLLDMGYDEDYLDDPSHCLVEPTLQEVLSWRGDIVLPITPSPNQASPNAGLAAAWIGAQLAANGDVLGGETGTDWGLTIDALFALASAGVGGDQIAATASKLYASVTAYVGDAGSLSSSWASVAKMVLALEVAGLDPTAFPTDGGPRNLITDLRSAMNANGSFGAAGSDNIFVHPLAMLALARTDGGVPPQVIDWVVAQQCTDQASANYGSYGWSPDCGAADPDSTAIVIQALIAAGVDVADPAVAGAKQWLKTQQDSSGGILNFGSTNTNTTGLAAQALSGDTDATASAALFIGGLQISCDTVEASGWTVVQADVGAIARDQEFFSTVSDLGMQEMGIDTFWRATSQAILGLGGPQFGSLSAQGVEAGLPIVPTCPVPDPGPGPEPGPDPGPDPSPDPEPSGGSSQTVPPTGSNVPAGGSLASVHGAAWLAVLAVLAGACLIRRSVLS